MLSLIHWLAGFSLASLHRLGGWLGWLAYAVSGTYRRRLRAHAALAGLSVALELASTRPVVVLASLRALLWPHFGQTHALVDDWAMHAAYGPVFAFGVLLARRQVLLQRLQALRWPALALGLAAWGVLVGYPSLLPGWPAVPEGLRLPRRVAFATAQWCGVLAAFGFARAHLNVDHRWRAPLTEAVFPLYLVHQTVTLVSAVALRPLALPVGVEAALIVVLTFGAGGLAWWLARRSGVLRPWLGLSARPTPAA
jgi:hypothetical protein